MGQREASLRAVAADAVAYEGRVGAFTVEVRTEAGGGALVLRPDAGAPLVLRVQGDALVLEYAGPEVRLVAPGADLDLGARNVTIRAEETLALSGRREVDVHSGEDVEIRADHQVNLWAHGVLVGD